MDKKTLLVAQIFMTCMMAFSMSGIMMVLAVGPANFILREWLAQFLMAWPIAFLMTQAVSRIAFPLAILLTKPKAKAP